MILVDTNIIIDFWKKPTEISMTVFETERIYICGIVKAELLHGAKDELSYNRIVKGLKCFPYAKLKEIFGTNSYLICLL